MKALRDVFVMTLTILAMVFAAPSPARAASVTVRNVTVSKTCGNFVWSMISTDH